MSVALDHTIMQDEWGIAQKRPRSSYMWKETVFSWLDRNKHHRTRAIFLQIFYNPYSTYHKLTLICQRLRFVILPWSCMKGKSKYFVLGDSNHKQWLLASVQGWRSTQSFVSLPFVCTLLVCITCQQFDVSAVFQWTLNHPFIWNRKMFHFIALLLSIIL